MKQTLFVMATCARLAVVHGQVKVDSYVYLYVEVCGRILRFPFVFGLLFLKNDGFCLGLVWN